MTAPAERSRLLELLRERETRDKFTTLKNYVPYTWQKNFMNAGKDHPQRLLMCANRVGKTFTGAHELTFHLTGMYPDWWDGRRFLGPVRAWACGKTNETTRDVVQAELLGPPDDITRAGTGTVPLNCIGDRTRKPQLPNALSSVLVKHIPTGQWSRLGFKAYEMGHEKFMGYGQDVIWLDEEPDMKIFTQCITRTADSGGMLYMTFTPEAGKTEVVVMFLEAPQPGMILFQAGWDDAPHIREDVKKQLLAVYPPYERDMRSKGIPIFGSGLVFPVHLLDEMTVDAFPLPDHFPRILGLDFGWDHPTAAIWCAVDPENDKVILYDEYGDRHLTPESHTLAIEKRSPGIPVSWPKDGLITEKGSGVQVAEHYRKAGLKMLPFHFTNSPTPDVIKGTVSVEAGILEMFQLMEQKRLVIFNGCTQLLRQIRQYHREDGKLYQKDDDYVQAARYAICARRFAMAPSQRVHWGSTPDYSRILKSIV